MNETTSVHRCQPLKISLKEIMTGFPQKVPLKKVEEFHKQKLLSVISSLQTGRTGRIIFGLNSRWQKIGKKNIVRIHSLGRVLCWQGEGLDGFAGLFHPSFLGVYHVILQSEEWLK